MLSAEQMAALVAELRKPSYASLTEAQAFDALHNGPILEDSETRPKPFASADLLTLLSDESAAKLVACPSLPNIRSDIAAQDRTALGVWVAIPKRGGVVSDSEATAIGGVLAATETITTQRRGHAPIRGGTFFSMPNRIDDTDFHLAYEASRS